MVTLSITFQVTRFFPIITLVIFGHLGNGWGTW